MFRIGEFSKLAQVPVKTLRYYDEIGLFKPAKVDERTGYRYYAPEQLAQIHRILALRDLGFSLQEIANFLRKTPSPEELRGMLRLREAELRGEMEEARRRLRRVAWRIAQLEEGRMAAYEVVVKRMPEQLVVGIRDVIPTYSDVGNLLGELFAYLGRHRAAPAGPPFAIWYDEEYRERDVDVEVLVPIASPLPEGERVRVRRVPGEEVASLVHKGPYAGIGEAYAHLISWIKANGYEIGGPSREVYLRGPESGCFPDGYVTELQFPVRKTG